MDPRQQIDAILPLVRDLVAGLDDEQLDAPTPCETFAVRDVLDHMIGGAAMFAAAFRGDAPGTPQAGVDPRAAFPAAMDDLQQAIHSPGAMERIIDSPFGQMPGDTFARLVAMDGIVHGWDIATAIGAPYDPPAEVVGHVDGFTRQALTDALRDGDTFAAAVEPPADASPIVRLAAFTGRKV